MELLRSSYKYLIIFFLSPIFILLNLFICLKILHKYKKELKPVHVFLANFFGNLTIQLFSSSFLLLILAVWPISEDWCIHYGFELVTMVSCCLSIISMQMDRFAAIFWDIKYKAHATKWYAVIVCVLNLIISSTIVMVTVIRNPQYIKCTFPPSVIFTRMPNLVIGGLAKLVSLGVTVLVSFYVIWKKKHLQNEVHPSLPPCQPPTEMDVRRLNSQPDMFFHIDNENRNPSAHVGTGQQNQSNNQEQETIFSVVKTTTTMNLLTLAFVIGFVPGAVLSIVFGDCEGRNECERFPFWFGAFNSVTVVYLFVVDIVAIKRLLTKKE